MPNFQHDEEDNYMSEEAVSGAKILPPGAVSKEDQIHVDALWTFDSSHHLELSTSDSAAYLRNINFSASYIHDNDRAVEFIGDIQSYIYIPDADGDFSGNEMGSWFFYIYPDPQLAYGCILEYEGNCPGGTGLSIRFNANRFEVHARKSDGSQLYGISQTTIPSGQWSYVGIMWHVAYPEIKVNINEETLETIMVVNVNDGETFEANGTIRIGASFNTSIPPFKGRIGCLMFKKGYFLKKKVTPLDYCDPNLRDSTFATEETEMTVTSGPANSGCHAYVFITNTTSLVNGTTGNVGNTSDPGIVVTLTGTTGTYRIQESCQVFVNGTNV